jgi:hypothetical protein
LVALEVKPHKRGEVANCWGDDAIEVGVREKKPNQAPS